MQADALANSCCTVVAEAIAGHCCCRCYPCCCGWSALRGSQSVAAGATLQRLIQKARDGHSLHKSVLSIKKELLCQHGDLPLQQLKWLLLL
jgi:hypothetical protein